MEHPAQGLAEGVQLVDTPGVGSIHHHNTETTRRFLSEVDAAIFITSTEQPVSESERTFLEEVRAEAARMFFVLNKADLLDAEATAEVVEFTGKVLGETLATEVSVYPLSALRALQAKQFQRDDGLRDSGLVDFERDFRTFLTDGKGLALLDSVAGAAQGLVTEEANALLVEEQTVRLPAEGLATTNRGPGRGVRRSGPLHA